MKLAGAAYNQGVQAALDSFGVRVAALQQRMPDGPEHLGAEWLSRALSQEPGERPHSGATQSYRKLEKPVLWGTRASLESTGAVGHNYSGMTPYGGV